MRLKKNIEYAYWVWMCVFSLGFFVLIGGLIWYDFAPSGEKEVCKEMGEHHPYIDAILPDNRVTGLQETTQGDAFVSLVQEPVYVSVLFPHRAFETMNVGLSFDVQGARALEVGALVDLYSQGYDLKPLYFEIIDALDWHEITQDGVRLLQRKPEYDSLEVFFADLPNRERIGVYHFDLPTPYRMPGYEPLGAPRTVSVSLRGYHRYMTYLKDETFSLEATYMDMNRTTGSDAGEIRLRNENGEVVASVAFEDDGNEREDQWESTAQIQLQAQGLQEGVYWVELSGTSDIFWRSLTTPQRYMVFTGKMHIADDVGYLEHTRATNFYTDAKNLVFETTHATGVQSLRIGSQWVSVSETHKKILHSVDESGLVYGYSPVGDVKITGDGLFAFERSMYFDPDPVSLNAYSDVDALGVEYILTTYQPAIQKGDWLFGEVQFDLSELARLDDHVKLILSVPGISQEDDVNIHAVHVTWNKPPMSFTDVFNAVRNLIPFGL